LPQFGSSTRIAPRPSRFLTLPQWLYDPAALPGLMELSEVWNDGKPTTQQPHFTAEEFQNMLPRLLL
jgi:hypothetical protein